METIPDIIRGFRAADGEVLRIAGAEAEPFAAVDPRHLRVEAAAGASARIVVLHTAPDVSSLTLTLAEGAIIAPESPCIRSLDKNELVVDLTQPEPSITVENEGYSRTYRLRVIDTK